MDYVVGIWRSRQLTPKDQITVSRGLDVSVSKGLLTLLWRRKALVSVVIIPFIWTGTRPLSEDLVRSFRVSLLPEPEIKVKDHTCLTLILGFLDTILKQGNNFTKKKIGSFFVMKNIEGRRTDEFLSFGGGLRSVGLISFCLHNLRMIVNWLMCEQYNRVPPDVVGTLHRNWSSRTSTLSTDYRGSIFYLVVDSRRWELVNK